MPLDLRLQSIGITSSTMIAKHGRRAEFNRWCLTGPNYCTEDGFCQTLACFRVLCYTTTWRVGQVVCGSTRTLLLIQEEAMYGTFARLMTRRRGAQLLCLVLLLGLALSIVACGSGTPAPRPTTPAPPGYPAPSAGPSATPGPYPPPKAPEQTPSSYPAPGSTRTP